MPIEDATPLQEKAIQSTIDYHLPFPDDSIIGPRYEEQPLMKRLLGGMFWGLAFMGFAYFLEDWLGEWAFWIGVVGDICIISAFASGLKYS